MGAWDPKCRVIEVENGLNGTEELMVLAHEYGHSLGFGRARDGDADTFAAEFLRQRRTRSLARGPGRASSGGRAGEGIPMKGRFARAAGLPPPSALCNPRAPAAVRETRAPGGQPTKGRS